MQKKDASQAPRIYVAISTSGKDGQMRLSGIFRYLREHRPWNIHLIRSKMELQQGSREIFDSMDGFIIATPHANDAFALLKGSNRPIVLMTNTIESSATDVSVTRCIVDNGLIGRTAARYFLSHGHFNAAAYIPSTHDSRWSRERQEAFGAAIGDKLPFHVFSGRSVDPTNDKLPDEELGDWLESLPHPVAVLAANDIHATQVLTICRARRISVPKIVSVLGVDNDELLAENAIPSLSSIEPDFEEAGYRAAAEMSRMLAQRRPRARRQINCGIKRLVERNSTSYLPPSAQLVANALAFVNQNAGGGATPDDVVRHLHVSRSLLELRMREIQGVSLATALRNRRLDLVKAALAKTQRPIGQVILASGFKNVRAAENLFRATTGLTPTEWRTRASRTP